ncbi:MAG: DNA polymerase III subunit alpha, partial [Treponema sp.]|nr:DNA polymerase III subunit alpha [Treponema sp.]
IAKLQDYNGFIELTFFPEGWKRSHHLIKDNEVFALYGKIGQSKEGEPSFIVDSVADMNDLKTRSITEIHIEVASVPKSDKDITKLKDIVFENEGNCSIFFHLNTTNGPYIIKGGRQFVVKADKYVIDEIRELDFVKDAWAS